MISDLETYKGHRIEINPVPEGQSDFEDFGWAFQVFKDNVLCFKMVIKTAGSRRTEANIAHVRDWGRQRVHDFIDNQNYERGIYYCYDWLDVPNNPAPDRVDCEGFLWSSQKGLRSVT